MRLEREIEKSKELRKHYQNEQNSLMLARKVMDGLDENAIIEPCPGCPNCTDGVDCFRITVYK